MGRSLLPIQSVGLVLGGLGLVGVVGLALRLPVPAGIWLALGPFPLVALAAAVWTRRGVILLTALSAALALSALILASTAPPGSLDHTLAFGALALAAVLLAVACMGQTRPAMATAMALVLAAGLVGHFSGAAGSGGGMESWLSTLGWPPFAVEATLFVFRKGVHFTFYLLVAGLAAWFALLARRGDQAVPFAMIWALGLALSDEGRQATLDSRTGSWGDIVLDMAGAAVGAWLAMRVSKQEGGRSEERP